MGCSRAEPAGGKGVEEGYLTPLEELGPATRTGNEKLRVVATTNILSDVVGRVGGDQITLARLVPLGADPHAYDPTARDMQAMFEAHVVFVNGGGLEAFMRDSLERVALEAPIVSLSEGITFRQFGEIEEVHQSQRGEEGEGGQPHDGGDPHVWLDPHHVLRWSDNAAAALSSLDPQGAPQYIANAAAFKREVETLDAWIREQVATLPEAQRKLVTDHYALGYFAERYGFRMVGAVVPGYSTAAEPSAQELAALIEGIKDRDVPAVFVGMGTHPKVAARVSEDTGAVLVPLYLGTLSEPEGPASSYLEMMRYDVRAVVEALGR
jgi:ABC-type Zn uptake system ZnuABC Zn-binding protein ZnuA